MASYRMEILIVLIILGLIISSFFFFGYIIPKRQSIEKSIKFFPPKERTGSIPSNPNNLLVVTIISVLLCIVIVGAGITLYKKWEDWYG